MTRFLAVMAVMATAAVSFTSIPSAVAQPLSDAPLSSTPLSSTPSSDATLSDSAPVDAQTGKIGGAGKEYYTNNGWTGKADHHFFFGDPTDEVYVGDWDGNGSDTLGIRRGRSFQLTNSPVGGIHTRFDYGRPGDQILVGDWDGDGKDTFAVRRGAMFYVSNKFGGVAQNVFQYGRAGDKVEVGDWNGDGKDSFAVIRNYMFLASNSLRGGKAVHSIDLQGFSAHQGSLIVGDWDGDGGDTFGFRNGTKFSLNSGSLGDYLRWFNTEFGRSTDTTFVGDWDGNATDTLGLRRVTNNVYKASKDVYKGFSTSEFSVDRISGPALMVIECPQCGKFQVKTDNGLTVNSATYYARGRYLINPTGGVTTKVRIATDRSWTVTFRPVSAIKDLPTGTGRSYDGMYDDVVRMSGAGGVIYSVLGYAGNPPTLRFYPASGGVWTIPPSELSGRRWESVPGYIQVHAPNSTWHIDVLFP